MPRNAVAASQVVRSAWWVRLLASLPFPVLYALAGLSAWISFRITRHREHVVRENLAHAFPELDEKKLPLLMRQFYGAFAQVGVEIVKAATMTPQDLVRRVRSANLELPRAELAQGRSVLLMTAHQCNWEWQLHAMALELGFPYYVAYKPLKNAWAEREMFAIRTRFGARLLPAPLLMPDLLKNRDVARGIAMAVDQEPKDDERKHWVRFLNRESAFYMGADRIARATGHAVFFVEMRRKARGFYELEFKPLAVAGEKLPVGELTERYARAVEAQIRRSPPDWPWSHKRWRLSKKLP